MKKSELIDLCYREFSPKIELENLKLEEVEYVREPKGNVLRFYIDKEEGNIDINDCEKVHYIINDRLDELDPIEEFYYLEVSSIGLDRPIKTDKRLKKVIGELVELKLFAPIDGSKEYTGVLIKFDDNNLVLRINEEFEKIFDRKKISTIKLSF